MTTNETKRRLNSARLLIARLERLSADSYWAHQASGLRGSLLRYLEQRQSGHEDEVLDEYLDQLLEKGFAILVKAAQELRSPVIDLPGARESSSALLPKVGSLR